MSKTLSHGKSEAQVSANHARRIAAVERNLSLEQARYGIPSLRDRLYLAAGVARGERCRNFEPAYAAMTAVGYASGARRYMAVYWPGDVCTGMTVLIATQGTYTDATPLSGSAIYSTDGTTLTRQAAQTGKWTQTTGEQEVAWSAPVNLIEGVYYVAIEYFETAHTTIPQFAAATVIDNSIWGGDTNNDWTPQNWPLMFSSSGAAAVLPASVAISGLTAGGATNMPYVGLY